jgi:excinuclease ABC subunit A
VTKSRLPAFFARVGIQHCTNCGKPVQRQSVDQIIDTIMGFRAGTNIQILAPVIRGRKGHYRGLFGKILKDGFLRVRIDGEAKEIKKGMQVNRYQVHDIEIVVDRCSIRPDMRTRIADSVETALKMGSGTVIVSLDATKSDQKNPKAKAAPGKDQLFSQHLACMDCGISYDEPAPNSFSFNSPYGSCPACNGLGEIKEFDLELIVPDEERPSG